PPLQGLQRYYGPARRPVPRRYPAPRGPCRLARSLSLPPPRGRSASTRLPVFPHASRRPGSRHLHAGHRLASRRVPARLVPGLAFKPRFRCRSSLSTLQRWFTRVHLPGPCLTALTPPFPHRSAPQSSARAPCGGLTPPPAGRRRRATKPSSCVQQASVI